MDSYEGLRTARNLLATADAAVFDTRPGELERIGLVPAMQTVFHDAERPSDITLPVIPRPA